MNKSMKLQLVSSSSWRRCGIQRVSKDMLVHTSLVNQFQTLAIRGLRLESRVNQFICYHGSSLNSISLASSHLLIKHFRANLKWLLLMQVKLRLSKSNHFTFWVSKFHQFLCFWKRKKAFLKCLCLIYFANLMAKQ